MIMMIMKMMITVMMTMMMRIVIWRAWGIEKKVGCLMTLTGMRRSKRGWNQVDCILAIVVKMRMITTRPVTGQISCSEAEFHLYCRHHHWQEFHWWWTVSCNYFVLVFLFKCNQNLNLLYATSCICAITHWCLVCIGISQFLYQILALPMFWPIQGLENCVKKSDLQFI